MCPIQEPGNKMKSLFGKVQKAVRNDIERAFGVIKAKCIIISCPSNFITVERMEIIMECVIIFHNMCVEERNPNGIIAEMEGESDVVGGCDINQMCCRLVRLAGQTVIHPDTRSIAALCEISSYMENDGENKRTKGLLPPCRRGLAKHPCSKRNSFVLSGTRPRERNFYYGWHFLTLRDYGERKVNEELLICG